MDDIDGKDSGLRTEIETLVRKMSFPRFLGTPNEARARQIVKDECNRLGLQFGIDPFKASDFFMKYVNQVPYYLLGLYVLVLTIIALVGADPLILLVMAVVLVVLVFTIEGLLRAIKYPAMYSRFARLKDCENITIEMKSSTPGTRNPVHVFFLAHSDGKSERPDPQRWLALEFVTTSFGSLALAVHLILFSIGAMLGGMPPHQAWVFFYGVVLSVIDMWRIATAYFEGDSPGASDDAIGVAITLQLMKCLENKAFSNVDVTGIITGAEEVGEAGTYQFIKKHMGELDPKRCHFIVLDTLCEPMVRYFTSYGYSFKPFSKLVRTALDRLLMKNGGSCNGISFRKSWMPPPVNTDHSPVVKLGYPAFLFESSKGVTHTTDDTPEIIDYAFAARFIDFLVALLREIDAIAGEHA